MSIIPILSVCVFSVVLYKIVKKKYDDKIKYVIKIYWFSYLLMIVFVIISFIAGEKFDLLVEQIISVAKGMKINEVADIFKYMFKIISPLYFAICSFAFGTALLYKDTIRFDRNSEIIKRKKRKETRLHNSNEIPFDFEKNIFICGKNGSGKTVATLNFALPHIQNREFCIILDGKGDTTEHSMYDVVTKLCKKYNRKLYIINQSIPDETNAYNPFKECNATQVKDMLINMSVWSEEHYKLKASEYFQALAQCLIDLEIDITFNVLAKYSVAMEWESLLSSDFGNFLNEDDKSYYYSVINRCYKDIEGSISRFITVAKGVGKKLFAENNTFNLQQAYDENAVVLVILNRLEYTDFAKSVGQLVINDIKNVLGKITKIKGTHKKFLCVYDELSVYFCDMLIDIVNKSRSLGATNILSTQAIADMDIINENLRRIVINNTHGFYILKQADQKSAEELANAIGTKKASEITSKIDSFGKTGIGTSKIIDNFKINPNSLKELPLEVGYWVDTTKEIIKPIKIKMPYVDVTDIDPFQFGEELQ